MDICNALIGKTITILVQTNIIFTLFAVFHRILAITIKLIRMINRMILFLARVISFRQSR